MNEESGLREECGVFGCVSTGLCQLDVSAVIATGLTGLQHRGQESSGIVVGNGECSGIKQHKGMGLVKHVFQNALGNLKGNIGIGHNRYSTAGSSSLSNCQPFVVETTHGKIALAHNGELFNAPAMKQYVMNLGTGLTSGSDSELITQILCHPPDSEKKINAPDWVARIKNFMERCHLSYSFLLMHKDKIYAVRDPFGNRPLCIGKLKRSACEPGASGDATAFSSDYETTGWIVSSETCSFMGVEANFHSYVKPGEIVELSREGVKTLDIISRPLKHDKAAFCIFEYVYFARPSSNIEGQLVYQVRERCGERLADEHPVSNADLVSTVPESATPAAIGFAKKSGIPYAEVLCKNSYVGRTFIQPSDKKRKLGVSMKFGVLQHNVKHKRIVLVDDSIVRGNTMAPIIKILKANGALEVHIRIASPPIKHPCYMGINIPTKEELIANLYSLEQLEQYMGADSIRYISVEGLESCVGEGATVSDGGYCTACLTGKYPMQLEW